MLDLLPTPRADPGFAWCQQQVAQHHYLRSPVDARSRPFAYRVTLDGAPVGCLIFGRPESTRCYDGALTYGSQGDVASGRARFDRWEILNLSRVWLHPDVQAGGVHHHRTPGYTDRRGVWRSTLASTVIGLALGRVGFDYLSYDPPCFVDEPYQVRAVLSYCDTTQHKGTIYRAAGFDRARVNERGIETWYTTAVAPLTAQQDQVVRYRSRVSPRAIQQRQRRRATAEQEVWV